VSERVYVYDRDGDQVLNAASGALTQARNVSWRTLVPGGYGDCTFEVPVPYRRGWDVREGQRVAVYDGLKQLYAGRIETITRTRAWRKVTAFGYGININQRLFTGSFNAGTVYADEILRAMATQAAPCISVNHIGIQSPGVNLVPVSWTNEYIKNVIDQLSKLGDNQTPPRKWYFAVWGDEGRFVPILSSDWHGGAASNQPNDPQWTGKVAGAGTIAMTPTYLRCNAPGVNSAAAMCVTKSPLPSNKVWRIEHRFRSTPSGWLAAILVKDSATQPVIDAAAPSGGTGTFMIRQHGDGKLKICYQTSAGAYQWWNGAAWQAGEIHAVAGAVNTFYIAILNSDSSGWWMQIQNAAGAVLTTTTGVSWANTAAVVNSLWLMFGDYATNYMYNWLDSEYVNVYSPASKPVAEFWPRDLSDYDLQIPLCSIKGEEPEQTNTLTETVNNVIASYGSPVAYTAAASDADSIDQYDQRDMILAAGNVSLALAEKARDMTLALRKDKGHRLGQFVVRGYVRDKAGARFPANRIRSGMRFILPELGSDVYMVGRTDYSVDTGEMGISIDGAPNTVEMLLAQMQRTAR
jgi:hypothetical protein